MLSILEELTNVTDVIMKSKDEGNESLRDLIKTAAASGNAAREINEMIIKTNESAEQISKSGEMIQSIEDISKASEGLAQIATDLQGEVSKFNMQRKQQMRKR